MVQGDLLVVEGPSLVEEFFTGHNGLPQQQGRYMLKSHADAAGMTVSTLFAAVIIGIIFRSGIDLTKGIGYGDRHS